MTTDQFKAVSEFYRMTDGRCDVSQLAGPHCASRRQQIMSLLVSRIVPRAQCGVNALRAQLNDLLHVTGDCIAARDACLRRRCENTLPEAAVTAMRSA